MVPKYKIVYQTKKNVWNNTKVLKKFKHKKWLFLHLKKKIAYKIRSSRRHNLAIARILYESQKKKKFDAYRDRYKRVNKYFLYKKKRLNSSFFKRTKEFKYRFFFKRISFLRFFSFNRNKLKINRRDFLFKTNFKDNLLLFQETRKSLGRVTLKQFKKLSYNNFGFKGFPLFRTINFGFVFRLDFVLNKLQLGPGIFFIRNLILHGYILVNNNKVYSPQFLLKKGDIISLDLKKSSRILGIILWKFYKKSLFYRKSILFSSVEKNWNICSFIVL